jgi:selenocysteine lyase/cysteine desulfurase
VAPRATAGADLAAIRALFAPRPGTSYLDAATYGLPPAPTVEVLRQALDQWTAGEADWLDDWDRPSDEARDAFAAIIGSSVEEISTIPASSVGTGLVAATLGPQDEAVVPADEFTSTLFPLLVARERGARLHEVPFEGLAEAIGPSTTLVAFSLVQMQTGRVADLAAIVEAAERHGARLLIDGTQAIPAVDLTPFVDRIDYLVCSAYKHLLCPRGTAFLRVRRDRWADLQPLNANWRAADDPYGRYFGGPLTLAADARRFDVSRAWFPWLGAATSLRLLAAWSRQGAFEEVRRLARGLAERLDVPWHGASLVCAPIDGAETVRAALREQGIRASVRGTAIRFSVHLYNTDDDLDRAARAIAPFSPSRS